ncbi:hypothetical protein LSAT2_010322, partial [Lamellibrachia satsuma]
AWKELRRWPDTDVAGDIVIPVARRQRRADFGPTSSAAVSRLISLNVV